MIETLKHQIEQARPSLRLVSPVSYWFILLMGVFNLLLGTSFILALDANILSDAAFSTIANLMPVPVWGIMFIVLGVVKISAIKDNNWELARHTLLAGVLLKSGWAVALTFRTFYQPDNIFLNLVWLTIAITQIICYIYFLPPTQPIMGEERDE